MKKSTVHVIEPRRRLNWRQALLVTVPIAALGAVVVWTIFAAGTPLAFEAEGGTVRSPATAVAVTNASGGSALQFGALSAAPTPTAHPGACQGAANTPGGSDGSGGCWPAAYNTGYPHGLSGDTRPPVTLTAYTDSCSFRTDNQVVDSKTLSCGGILIYAKNVTIKNSKINGPIYTNADTASITISDTEIDGGSDHSQATGVNNLTLTRDNIYGNQHSVHCYGNCTVTDSWLHDNFDGSSQGWHENSFITNGGSHFVVRHNSAHCTGSCTADLTLIPDDNVTDMTVDHNLMVAAPTASYCLYPSSNHPSKAGIVQQIKVTNNVFQRGANGKCGAYGPVYDWDTPNNNPGTDGYGNVWSNNQWDDGTVVNP